MESLASGIWGSEAVAGSAAEGSWGKRLISRVASTIAGPEQKPGRQKQSVGIWTAWGEAFGAALAAERPQAVLFAPVLVGTGIALWFLLPWNGQRQAALLLALATALLGFVFTAGWRRLLLASGLLLALGLLAAEWRSASTAVPRLHHRLTAAPMTGEVLSLRPHEGGARHTLLLRRDASTVDPPITVRLSLGPGLPAGLEPGARVELLATLGPVPGPALPGAHDPARRAWFDGISASGRVLEPPVVLAQAPAFDRPLARSRESLGAAVADRLGGDAGSIAAALTVGDQGRVRADLLEAMRISGLAHILTVSGFHIAVLVGGLLFLLRRLLGLWSWLALRTSVTRIAAVLAGLGGTAYALLSGAEPPAVRAAIAAWVVLLALMMGRDPLAPRLIAFAALLILLARPEALINPSFQLSFAAVTALVALARSPLGARLSPRNDEGILRRAARWAAALALTGIVAELVLTPIALSHFGRAGAYGVVANLAAVPLTSLVIMPLLGGWLLLAPIGLGGLVEWALVLSLDALAGIGLAVAAWPGATLTLPAMPSPAMHLLVAGALILMLLVGRLRWAGLPLLAAGSLWAVAAPRPDLLVSADGRQVGVVANGQLHTLRGHRGGFVISNWAEQADAAPTARLEGLPGARCTPAGCTVPVGGLSLLALTEQADPERGDRAEALLEACRRADIVTAPFALPVACTPRWQRLDMPVLRRSGATAIQSGARRIDTVAARAGDQPWSPSASPGERPSLLGTSTWTGVIAE
jgi:competence protein ComEC